MPTTLVTGFPGFLGHALVPRLLDRDPERTVVCLVQPHWAAAAREAVAGILRDRPGAAGRLRLMEGDITRPAAGLADPAGLRRGLVEIYHLAAVYDLEVPADVAERVNVDGTRHLVQLAEAAPGLRRVHHVSTCYVSGRFEGRFRESDLDRGQTFKNHYEATKYRAEVVVHDAMARGVPCTIYRPAAVVGDSTDGATRKLDGAYMFVRLVVRQRGVAFVPVSGDVDRLTVNIVPRDFVVDALAALAARDDSSGRTYHLADPSPDSVGGMLRDVGRAAGRRVVRVPLPLWLARGATRRVPGVRALTGIPPEAVDYYDHRATYDVTGTLRDLQGTGIRCPPFASYVHHLVRFVRDHPDMGSGAMV